MTLAAQKKITGSRPAAIRHDPAALHDEDDPGRIAPQLRLGERIARYRDQVRLLARLQRADLIGQAEQLRRLRIVAAWMARNGPSPYCDM
jgi:hypothetical protein